MNPFSKQSNIPHWLVLLIDIEILLISYIISNFILNSFSNTFSIEMLLYQIPIILIVYYFSFIYFKTYNVTIKKTELKNIQNILIANFVSYIILFSITFIFKLFLSNYFTDARIITMIFKMSYSILFIQVLITSIIMVNFRIFYRYFFSKNKKITHVLIYGAGNSGCITKDILQNDIQQTYKIVGFIDDNPTKKGKQIDRIKIFSVNEITENYIHLNNISQIIIAIQNATNTELIELSESIEKLPVEIKIIPPTSKWNNGIYKSNQIQQLKIEDLFGRKSIKLNNTIFNDKIKDKVIFITGAAGSIGSEISHQISTMNFGLLVLIDQAESALYDLQQSLKYIISEKKQKNIHYIVGSIRDKHRMFNLFKDYRPHLIFHAAAYKHVPLMESFPYEAINTNIQGTKIIADLAHQFNSEKFVMISTDKAVNPTNVMGATKRVAEIYVNCINKDSKTNYIVTRFGNVLGSTGSVIPLFKKQLAKGGPLTVTDANITRYFMSIAEAANLVLKASIMGKGGEIFVFDMGKSIKIFDLAKKMIRLNGFKYPEDIDIKIIGLRPGEKIYEELIASNEKMIKTNHEKIMIAKVDTEKYDENKILIEELCLSLSKKNNKKDIIHLVAKIKQIVPEFKSQNSEFEKLDNIIDENNISRKF